MKYEDQEIYHIYNRGAHKGRLFFGADNYRFCLRLMEKYRDTVKVGILAYCLMPNHYHFLLVQKMGGSISKLVQCVFNSYTQAVNKQQRQSGTLFQGRAKARHIRSESDALIIARYIHLNPVEAHLVKTPDTWEFSDYRSWCGETDISPESLILRGTRFNTGKEYADFVGEYRMDRAWVIPIQALFEETQ